MPFLACNPRGGLVRLDDIDFWMVREQGRCRGVPVQLAEPPTEFLVLLHAQFLVVEKDDQMIQERITHLLKLLVVERFGKVNPKDLGANVGRQLAYFYGPVTHTWPFPTAHDPWIATRTSSPRSCLFWA